MNFAKFRSRIVLLLVCLGASACLAATHPLNFPRGLAVDGNLYVANAGANQVLVYSPSGVQMTAKTITTNINAPAQLPAFQLSGQTVYKGCEVCGLQQHRFIKKLKRAHGDAGPAISLE